MKRLFGKMFLSGIYLVIFFTFLGHIGKGKFFYLDKVDEKLSILLEKTAAKVDLIIAGDSRALYQIIPRIIEEKTGLRTINIAAPAYHLPGIYDHLKKRKMLDKGYTIVISISAQSIDDFIINEAYLPVSFLSRMPWRDRCEILGSCFDGRLWRTYLHYYMLREPHEIFMSRFLFARDVLFHSQSGAMNDEILLYDGFTPLERQIDGKKRRIEFPALDTYPRPAHFHGLKWKVYQQVIAAFGSSKCRIIFLQPPIAPGVKSQNAEVCALEREFSQLMEDETNKYGNIHFIRCDHIAKMNAALTDDHFADGLHVNSKGAEVFTSLLTDELLNKGFLKKNED